MHIQTFVHVLLVYTFEKEKKIAMHIQTFVHVLYIHLKNKKKIMGSWCWKTSQMAEFQTQPKCQPNLATHHWGMGLGRGWDLQPVPQPHINPGPNPQGLSYPWQSLPTTMTHRSTLPMPAMMTHRLTLPTPPIPAMMTQANTANISADNREVDHCRQRYFFFSLLFFSLPLFSLYPLS